MSGLSLIGKLGRPLLASVLLGLSCQAVANPTGAQILNGSVQMNSVGGQLTIHNSPNAIINWQNFSISRQEITRFIQENGSSAVLNRVVGQNPSEIMGKLLSNGHVFLINPNGIVFGANAMVDTAGLVASSLNLSDDDFLSGNYRFHGDANSGDVINRGLITTGKGGEVVLIAPTVENSGVISVEDGNILLAAGEKMTLSSLDLEGIEFEVQAPDNKVMNLGKLLANGGSVGVFAGSLTNTGVISANSVRQGANGELWLEASDSAKISGELLAGDITITADEIALINARIDASGSNGGGQVRIGGDYQGAALAAGVANAKKVTVDANTTIQANAIEQGNGGRVIIWSDENTQVDGHISATGGKAGGDGGFVETSGKKQLDFANPVDVSARNGKPGTWLIDPEDIIIDSGKAGSIETALNNGSSVSIKTSDSGSGEGNITVASSITKTKGGDASLSLTAHNKIDVNAPIISTSNKLNVKLKAGSKVNINANISTNGGSVSTAITGLESEPTTESPGAGSVEADPLTEPDVPVEVIVDTGEAAVPPPEVVILVDAPPVVDVVPGTRINSTIETLGGDISVNAGEMGTVEVSGVLDTSNLETARTGGNIDVLGDQISLTESAVLDASGDAGGGMIRVGGDYQGQGDTLTASNTSVAEGATIKADAITEGDGGKVIVWSDDTTVFHGNISATGGEQGGDGGFAEVSGKQHLLITGHADLHAENGEAGTLLLDPGSVSIEDDSGGQTPPPVPAMDTFYNSWITTQLDGYVVYLGSGPVHIPGSDLTISTANADNSDPANINVNAPISWSSDTSLTLVAGNDINVDATITNAIAPWGGGGTLELSAGGNNNINQEINLAGGGGLKLIAGGVNYVNANILMEPGSGNINATGGNGTVTFNSGNTVTVRAASFDADTINVNSGTTTFENSVTPAAVSTNDLTQTGGTIGGANAELELYGLYNWSGGHNSLLKTTITDDGSLLINGGAHKYLDSGILLNESEDGSNAWTGTGWMYSTDGGSIENAGRLVLGGRAGFNDLSSAGSTFSNSGTGTLIRTAEGTNIGSFALFGTTFNNAGILDVQKGEFRLYSASNHSGTVNVASGATLGFWNQGLLNTHNLNKGTLLQGDGLIQIGGTSILSVNTNLSAGTGLDFNLFRNGAALGGAGNLAINGIFDWSAGSLDGSGTVTVGLPGQLLISGAGDKTLSNGTLRNESASSVWVDNGTISSNNSGSLDNTGTLYLQGDGIFSRPSGNGIFSNSGSLVRNTSTGTFLVDRATFNNSGSVDVQTGTLKLQNNSNHSGSLNVDSGAALQLGSYNTLRTHNLNANASLTGNGTVELIEDGLLSVNTNLSSDVARLLLNSAGAEIGGSGNLTVNGILDWVSGAIKSSGTTTVGSSGQLLISGAGAKSLHNGTLRNESATSTWTSDGYLYSYDDGSIENTGTLVLSGNGKFSQPSDSAASFSNSGELIRNTSTGTFLIDRATFNNSGSIDVQTGTLKLAGNSNHSDSLKIADGAKLQFSGFGSGATHNLNSGTAFTGEGIVEVVDVSTLNINAAVSSGSGIRFLLNHARAKLAGDGDLTIDGLFDWTSGNVGGTGTTTVSSSGQLLLSGSGIKYIQYGTLHNISTSSIWSGDGIVYSLGGGSLDNAGALQLQGDGTLSRMSGDGSFTNSGTLTRNTSTGIFLIDRATFNNSGSVNVQTGTLKLQNSSNHSDNLNVAGGATLQFASPDISTTGTHDLNSGTTVTGNGTVELVERGVLNLNTAVSSGPGLRIKLSGYDYGAGLAGNSNLTVNGILDWQSGAIMGSGTTTVSEGGQLLIGETGTKYLSNGTLRNESASSQWLGNQYLDAYNSAVFENIGTLALLGDTYFQASGSGATFTNSGALIRNASTDTGLFRIVKADFDNTGTIDVQKGILKLETNSNHTGVLDVADGATLQLGSWGSHADGHYVHTLDAGTVITGSGTLEIVDWGELNVNTDLSSDTGVRVFLNNSDAGIAGSGSLTVNGLLELYSGEIRGSGTTTVTSGGQLLISGNPYLANGTLRNESDSSLWTGTWLYAYDTGTFENAGTLQLQGFNGGFYADTAGNLFDNSGTLIRNTRSGAVTFEGVTFNNSGSIDVQTGSLVMIEDGSGTHPLNFNWTEGTLGGAGEIIFDSGAHLNISGSGAHVLDGLSLTVDDLTLDAGSLEVRSGTLNAFGITTIADGMSLNLTGGDLDMGEGAQLDIAGILGWSGGRILGDGELDIAATGQFDYSAAGPSSVDFDITNANVFNVSNGALNVEGSFDQSDGTTTINAGGSLDVSNGYTMTAGTTQINGGGTLSTDVYTQNGGTTAFVSDANGPAALNASTSVNFNSGNVSNVGTITSPNVNLGAVTLAPGFSPGTMNIAGNLTLSSSTILDFEVGPNASSYDILNVSGLMDFGDASMNLNWYGGYVPTDLDSFQVVNYASHTGSLSTVNAPVPVDSNYQPGSLLLSVNLPGSVLPATLPPVQDVLPLSTPGLSEDEMAALVYAASAEIIPVVTTIIEDSISQWPYDPSDLRNSFVLTGAVNGGNGDRLTVAEASSDSDSKGRGQKVYINGDGPGTGLRVLPDQMCN